MILVRKMEAAARVMCRAHLIHGMAPGRGRGARRFCDVQAASWRLRTVDEAHTHEVKDEIAELLQTHLAAQRGTRSL